MRSWLKSKIFLRLETGDNPHTLDLGKTDQLPFSTSVYDDETENATEVCHANKRVLVGRHAHSTSKHSISSPTSWRSTTQYQHRKHPTASVAVQRCWQRHSTKRLNSGTRKKVKSTQIMQGSNNSPKFAVLKRNRIKLMSTVRSNRNTQQRTSRWTTIEFPPVRSTEGGITIPSIKWQQSSSIRSMKLTQKICDLPFHPMNLIIIFLKKDDTTPTGPTCLHNVTSHFCESALHVPSSGA